MQNRIEFIGRRHKRENDCWNDALAYAFHMPHWKVRLLLKPFISKNGTMNNKVMCGFLESRGFMHMEMSPTEFNLSQIVQLVDSHHNHVVVRIDYGSISHVVYIRDKKIYDFENKDMLEKYVINVFVKER